MREKGAVQSFARRFLRNRAAAAGGGWVAALILICALAPWLAAGDPLRVGRDAFAPPGAAYWFGTDNQGRDIWSGILHGARVSLMVGFLAAITSSSIGIAIGAAAGFCGRWVDALLMRLTELFQIMPRFFLALIIISLFGAGIGKVIFVIGVLGWPPTARLIRAEFMTLKEREFIEAGRATGMGNMALCFRHILPNALPPAVVAGSLDVAQAILLEASLSFFGMGDPNLISWGTMLYNAQGYLRQGWWMSVFPGTAIFLAVIAFNLMGDGINEALNPRLREREG
ncbi:MAG: ABC transporter permease [Candidatus Tectomicrobia bacterium]|uniref:ABC transporter permease n=1 Tax=Tectimicrobiota bacterium TaxID=2528274 RepID=A0A932ZTH1_UNCTE|nr:ABC transporter permease [Candidatus Tectomicrobia bacterium]